MAVRAERMEAEALARKAGAKICVPRHLKELSIKLGDIRELRNPQGAVYKVVQQVRCHAKLDGGVGVVDMTPEMEVNQEGGALHEVRECLKPALLGFIDAVVRAIMDAANERSKPLDPDAPPPLLSDPNRPKDENKSLRMKEMNVRLAEERRAARKAAEAAAAEAGDNDAKGGGQ